MGANGGLGAAAFTSVVVGVVDAAMDYVRPRIKNGMASDPGLRAYQQVEWAHAEQEAWLIGQAWEGALRCLETNTGRRELLLAKEKRGTSVGRLPGPAMQADRRQRLHSLFASVGVVRRRAGIGLPPAAVGAGLGPGFPAKPGGIVVQVFLLRLVGGFRVRGSGCRRYGQRAFFAN